jgi:hypothetical protein
MSRRRDILAGSVALLVIMVVLVLGFLRLGSPWSQREITADLRRALDLGGILQAISLRHASGLPARLEELGQWSSQSLKDPLTGAPYEYHPKAGTAYELCATFSRENWPSSEWDYRDGGPPLGPFRKHPAGRYCYQLDASWPPSF